MEKKVLCLIEMIPADEEDLWRDDLQMYKESVIPLIDHLHNDIENGQPQYHYHIDDRYDSLATFDTLRIDLPLKKWQRLEYRLLPPPKRDKIRFITPVGLTKNSRLKHKCIHKGKCPHRGYDLSNEAPDEKGEITCPLHGLIFDKNGRLKL